MKEGGKRVVSAAPSLAKGAAVGIYKGTKGVFQGGGMLTVKIADATHKKKKKFMMMHQLQQEDDQHHHRIDSQ